MTTPSRIAMVGAGPGDVGLVTCRALELIAAADVLVVDSVVGESLASFFPRGVERFSTPRRCTGFVPLPAAEVVPLLVSRSLEGKRVVRVKSSDPLFFGSGCDEILECRAAGAAIEIVPGVPRVTAGPSLAGIPLAQRGVAGSVLILPGKIRHARAKEPAAPEAPHGRPTTHRVFGAKRDDIAINESSRVELVDDRAAAKARIRLGPGGSEETHDYDVDSYAVDWPTVCRAADTLVFEGVTSIGDLEDGLLAGGRSESEPAAMIAAAATTAQHTAIGTIGGLRELFAREKPLGPLTVVVGDVVSIRQNLSEYEQRPLFGMTFAIAGAMSDPWCLEARLLGEGAAPLALPLRRLDAPHSLNQVVQELLDDFSAANALVVESADSARNLVEALERSWLDWRILPRDAKVLACGQPTAEVLERAGLRCEAVERHQLKGDFVIEEIAETPRRHRVLLAGGAPMDALAQELVARGHKALHIPVYEEQTLLANVLTLKTRLERGTLDGVLFTTPEEVALLEEHWGAEDCRGLLGGVLVGALDIATAQALTRIKITAHVVPAKASHEALVRELSAFRASPPAP
ncbi:MAG: SAM-dependent methyltransferase [Candidatus Sumerlaeia bacterium]|nr:SAM-dependent methyltransferase [Candidatus Sumerlaeia bacterium]